MSLNSKDVEALEIARYEANLRIAKRSYLKAIDIPGAVANSSVNFVAPGTLGIFVTEAGSCACNMLRQLKNGNWSGVEKFSQFIVNDIAKNNRSDIPTAVAQLIQKPQFYEIQSSGKILASNIFLPDGLSCLPLAFPYTGGKLPEQGLELVQYTTSNENSGLELFAFKQPPDDLTSDEIQALQLLGEDQLSLNVGIGACFAATGVAVALVVSAVVALCSRPNPDFPTPDPGPIPTPDPGPIPTPDPGPIPIPIPDPGPIPTPDPRQIFPGLKLPGGTGWIRSTSSKHKITPAQTVANLLHRRSMAMRKNVE